MWPKGTLYAALLLPLMLCASKTTPKLHCNATEIAWESVINTLQEGYIRPEFSLRRNPLNFNAAPMTDSANLSWRINPEDGTTTLTPTGKTWQVAFNLYLHQTNSILYHCSGGNYLTGHEETLNTIQSVPDDDNLLTIIMPIDWILPHTETISLKILGRNATSHRWFGILGTW